MIALWWLACTPPAPSDAPSTPGTELPPTPDPTLAIGPSGAHLDGDRVVFRVPSRAASRVEVWLYAAPRDDDDALVLPLAPVDGRFVGAIGLSELADAGLTDLWYGLRAWGPNWPYDPDWSPGTEVGFLADVDAEGNRFNPNKLLIDPWARELSHDPLPGDRTPLTGPDRALDSGPTAPKGLVLPPLDPPAAKPRVPLRDSVVVEVHLRGLTKLHPDVPEAERGTYAGAARLAPWFAALGVTAVELLPLHETTNDQNDLDPTSADGDNYWGYSSLSYFAPDRRYAADRSPGGPTRELKAMIDAFHAHGVEVWVDVVLNHTAEGGAWDGGDTARVLSWRGLDNPAFYQLDGPRGYRDDNGVGPNVNVADPLTREHLLDALRYGADALGIDGYRYDLAAILGNRCQATCFDFNADDPSGLLQRIAAEIDAKPIAEPWAVTTWQGGRFPAGWAEWNDGYRDSFRAHQNRLAQTGLTLRTLRDRFEGSPDRFDNAGRQPWHSVNFLVAHDGFTLGDLYRCDEKDNDQPWPWGPSDGGSDFNQGWDQGGDPAAQRQAARTGMAWLLLSAGVPMWTGGDEWLRTQGCNNNPYNLDSPAMWLDWSELDAFPEMHAFLGALTRFRADHPALRPTAWGRALTALTPDGAPATDAYLDEPSNHALALRVPDPAGDDVLLLLNGWVDPVVFALPAGTWRVAFDTHADAEPSGNHSPPGAEPPAGSTHAVGGRSIVVLVGG